MTMLQIVGIGPFGIEVARRLQHHIGGHVTEIEAGVRMPPRCFPTAAGT